MRQMTLVAFLQAQNCTNFASSWRHPQSRTDSWSPDYYRHIGRVLEAGKFHLGFFDDRLAMPDMYGRDHAHTVEHGIRCVKLDPVTVLTVMGMATERLGLGATYSTTYYEPFHVARVFATLDLMTQRARRLERRHLAQRRRGAEHGPRRGDRARPALRPRRRVHGGRARPLGHLGGRRHRAGQGDAACSPIPTRSIASTTRAASSARAGRSPCRARRRAIRSSSRPARAAAAGASPRAGAS